MSRLLITSLAVLLLQLISNSAQTDPSQTRDVSLPVRFYGIKSRYAYSEVVKVYFTIQGNLEMKADDKICITRMSASNQCISGKSADKFGVISHHDDEREIRHKLGIADNDPVGSLYTVEFQMIDAYRMTGGAGLVKLTYQTCQGEVVGESRPFRLLVFPG